MLATGCNALVQSSGDSVGEQDVRAPRGPLVDRDYPRRDGDEDSNVPGGLGDR